MTTEDELRQRYAVLLPLFNERHRRLLLGADALEEGRGGISKVARAAGVSRHTVYAGITELKDGACIGEGRVRRPGGGRKPLEDTEPGILAALDKIVDPVTRGDPESSVKWTSKSCVKLMHELQAQGYTVSDESVRRMLHALDYSLQAPVKVLEGTAHPDRDAQFDHIQATVQAMQEAGEPVISVDTKKKELIGEFTQGGREWRAATLPVEVNAKDFPDLAEGIAIPYGVYDRTFNEGWISVGIDHDTAELAVDTIRCWWHEMGRERYPSAAQLLIAENTECDSAPMQFINWCLLTGKAIDMMGKHEYD